MEDKRILYGDDNEQLRNSLARALRLRNYDVDLVASPQDLIAKARANNYEAIVTDLEYSECGREGYDVLKQIRELRSLKVLYSGVSGFEFEAEALESGADYVVLRKDSSKLLELLDRELNAGGKDGK